MARLTGSGLERARECPGSAILPGVGSTSDYAERGRAIHRFLELAGTNREAALAGLPDDLRPLCEALDVAHLPTDPKRFAAEVAFAYNPDTGEARELGRGIGRRYEVTGNEIPGTADVTALLDNDAVFVADFKSGWSRRTAAKDSWQLRFYALAAARAYKRSRAVVQVIRLFEDGTTWTDEAFLDAFALDDFALDLAAMVAELEAHRTLYAEGVEPPLTEGDHCRWCPAFTRCPAKTSLLMAPPSVEITPEGAAQAYQRLRFYEAALDKAKEILRDYARAHPIPLPDGQVYGVRYDNTRSIDSRVAAQTLREILGDAAEAAISVEVTQASIKRAIAGTGRSLGDVLAVIEARGGLRTVKAPKLVAHTPKGEP